jgi:hypothetical protein
MNTQAEFVIEDGVPISLRNLRHMYPFDRMQVGQSFAIPPDLKHTSVASASRYYTRDMEARGQKVEFRVRKLNGSYRCWRTI